MGQRAEVLAERFERANEELIAFVERCSAEEWAARSELLGWTVGAIVHHLAVDHTLLAYIAEVIATGQPLPGLSVETIDQMNRQHAEQHDRCAR